MEGVKIGKDNNKYDNLDYPKSWKYEKFFIKGYGQERMIKIKNPKIMYKSINLFADNYPFSEMLMFGTAS